MEAELEAERCGFADVHLFSGCDSSGRELGFHRKSAASIFPGELGPEPGGLWDGYQCGEELHGSAMEGGADANSHDVYRDGNAEPFRCDYRHLRECGWPWRRMGKARFARVSRSDQCDSWTISGELRLENTRRI